MKIKHLQTKMLIFILLPMIVMLTVIIVLNYKNMQTIYTEQLEANMKKKLQIYTNDFNGFLMEKGQVSKDLALFSQTKELINTASYPLEDRHNDPLFMTTISDFQQLRNADMDKAILQIFMGLENTDEAYYDNWEKRKGTDILTIPRYTFQKEIIDKLSNENDKKIILQSYQITNDKSTYKLKNGYTLSERKNILEIMKKAGYGYHVTSRSWYKDVKGKQEFCFSNAYIDTSLLIPVVSALTPIFDKDNQMTGAVGADISLEYLTDKIKELKIEGIESNYTFLVDDRGYYIAYAYPDDEAKYIDKIDVEDKKTDIVNKIQKEKSAFIKAAATYKNKNLIKIGNDIEYVSERLLTLANISENQIKEYNLQNYLTIIKSISQSKANEEDFKRLSEILSKLPKQITTENVYISTVNKIFKRGTSDSKSSVKTTEQEYNIIRDHLLKISNTFLDNQQISLKTDILKQIESDKKIEITEAIYPKLIALGQRYELKSNLTNSELILINDVVASINETKMFKFKDSAQYEILKNIANKYKKISLPDLETVSFLPPKMKDVTSNEYYQNKPEDYYLIFMPIPTVKWSIGLYVSKAQALKPVREMLKVSLILSIAAIIILILIIIFLKGIILQPIQALAKGMKEVEGIKFDAKVEVKSQDEIGQMTNIYNLMLDGLQERDTKLNNLISVSRTIATETELQALLDLIMNNSTDLLEADIGTIFLYDKNYEYLVHEVSKGWPLEIAKTFKYKTGIGLVGTCARQGHILNIPDAYANDLFDQNIDKQSGFRTKNILCVPIITTTGKTIGVVELKNKIGDKVFNENDEKLLSAFTSLASISIENARALKEIKATMNTFQLFVPPKFLERIAKEGVGNIKVGNATQETISILFSDIRNFTTMSEKMAPEEVFTFLNEYMEEMNICIKANDGFIDKFIGDAIMALFDGKHADGAVHAAIDMNIRLREYNKKRLMKGEKPIAIGCGVNTGSAIIGTLGSSDRMDGTVIGDCVNLASRLEGLTKMYGSTLLISSFTKNVLEHPENFLIREVDAVKVKGKDEIVTIYEVFNSDSTDLIEAKLKSLPILNKAIALYRLRKWDDAIKLFNECKEIMINDKVVMSYIDRIEQHKISAPHEDWDGSYKFDHK